ncbi:hypothetical protein SH668x_000819 [Planctomicrobium sp. SH668]|uniref:hypothetical protein n=1 Tax=Planctomicrobium sp. SH668 TaxID=3448126 RepID=UPI003F5BA3AF
MKPLVNVIGQLSLLLVFAVGAGWLCGTPLLRTSQAEEPAIPLFAETQEEGHSAPEEPSPTSSAEAVPAPEATTTQEDLQSLKEQRFRELKRQMEILSQMSDQKGPRQEEPAQFPQSQTPESEVPTANGPSPEVPPVPVQPRPWKDTPPSTPRAAELLPMGPLVVEGAIDRFSLASSLFGTGEYETCLEVLKQTNLKELARIDQIWAEYLQASCHRKCGRVDLAKQSYRRLLAESDADWVGEMARWWLTEIDAKAQLQDDVKRLGDSIKAWEKEIESLASESARATALR